MNKGWAIYTPTGHLMISTISVNRRTAKRKCLEPLEQKYHGLVNTNFKKWKNLGYECHSIQINKK